MDGKIAASVGKTSLTVIISDGVSDSAAPSSTAEAGQSEIGRIYIFVVALTGCSK